MPGNKRNTSQQMLSAKGEQPDQRMSGNEWDRGRAPSVRQLVAK